MQGYAAHAASRPQRRFLSEAAPSDAGASAGNSAEETRQTAVRELLAPENAVRACCCTVAPASCTQPVHVRVSSASIDCACAARCGSVASGGRERVFARAPQGTASRVILRTRRAPSSAGVITPAHRLAFCSACWRRRNTPVSTWQNSTSHQQARLGHCFQPWTTTSAKG